MGVQDQSDIYNKFKTRLVAKIITIITGLGRELHKIYIHNDLCCSPRTHIKMSALGRHRQEASWNSPSSQPSLIGEFRASLGYTTRP